MAGFAPHWGSRDALTLVGVTSPKHSVCARRLGCGRVAEEGKRRNLEPAAAVPNLGTPGGCLPPAALAEHPSQHARAAERALRPRTHGTLGSQRRLAAGQLGAMGIFGSKGKVVWVPVNEKLKAKCDSVDSWSAKERCAQKARTASAGPALSTSRCNKPAHSTPFCKGDADWWGCGEKF